MTVSIPMTMAQTGNGYPHHNDLPHHEDRTPGHYPFLLNGGVNPMVDRKMDNPHNPHKDRPIFFPRGLYGFEQYHDFRHLTLGTDGVSVLICCALPQLRFLMAHTDKVTDFGYHPTDIQRMIQDFGATGTWDLYHLLTIRLEQGEKKVTANVLAPLLIQHSGTAHQLVLDGGRYPTSAFPIQIAGL